MRINLSFMRSGKTVFAMFTIYTLLLLTFFFSGNSAFSGQGKGNPQLVAIQGRAKIQGQDAVCEILVVVHPGENAEAKAKGILKRMYPGAEEISSANFSLTGLFWDVIANGSGNAVVPFVYNDSNEPIVVDGSAVMQAAFQTWNDVKSSIFKFEFSGNTNQCPSLVEECGVQVFNGINEIAWLDITDPSVLGVTWFGLFTDEFDMALDNVDFTWYDGDPSSIPANAFDLQTVWLHEFGHGLGLGHSVVDCAVMEPFYEGPRRALHHDDIDGITSLYPSCLNCDLIINIDGSIDLAINNNCNEPVSVELKMWATISGSGQNFPWVNFGSDGSLTFPAGFSTVNPIVPAGATFPSNLKIGTRFLDPVTGQEFCVDTELIP